MEPESLARRDVGDRRHRVHARRPRRPDGRAHRDGSPAGGPVLGDRTSQRRRIHPELGVGRDLAHALPAQAEDDRALLDRGVRLVGRVDAEAGYVGTPGHPLLPDLEPGGLARRGERAQRGDRRRVVDDAAEGGGQAEELPEPVEDDVLQLGGGRRRAPEHGVDVERGAEELAEDPRSGAADCEVREEARVVPVGDARKDHALEVREDPVERLRALRRRRGQGASNVAGLHAGQDGVSFRRRQEPRDPVHDLVAVPPELLGIEVAERSLRHPVTCHPSSSRRSSRGGPSRSRRPPACPARALGRTGSSRRGYWPRRNGQEDRGRAPLGDEVPLRHSPHVLACDRADAGQVRLAQAPAAEELVARERRRAVEDGVLTEQVARPPAGSGRAGAPPRRSSSGAQPLHLGAERRLRLLHRAPRQHASRRR